MDVYKLIKSVVAHETRKLRAENERLRTALERIGFGEIDMGDPHSFPHPPDAYGMKCVVGIARAALAPQTDATNSRGILGSSDATPEQPATCEKCGGSGFSGYGSGYDAVCEECGGQSARRPEQPAAERSAE